MVGWIIVLVCAFGWFGFDVGRKRLVDNFSATQLLALVCAISVFLATPLFFFCLYYGDPNGSGGAELFYVEMPPTTLSYWKIVLVAASINLFSNWLFVRAVDISPFSLTIPYLSLTPVFAALLSLIVNEQMISVTKAVGISLVFLGSFFLNPGKAGEKRDWLGPVKALRRERGSLYMIVVAACWAVSLLIDSYARKETQPITHIYVMSAFLALGYGLIVVFTDLRSAETRAKIFKAAMKVPTWLIVTAIVAFIAQVTQVASTSYFEIEIIEIVKRAVGVLGSVIVGYLLFNEKDVKQRLVGATVMTIGVTVVLSAELF